MSDDETALAQVEDLDHLSRPEVVCHLNRSGSNSMASGQRHALMIAPLDVDRHATGPGVIEALEKSENNVNFLFMRPNDSTFSAAPWSQI